MYLPPLLDRLWALETAKTVPEQRKRTHQPTSETDTTKTTQKKEWKSLPLERSPETKKIKKTPQTYIVKPGDKPSTIAHRLGVSLESLLLSNLHKPIFRYAGRQTFQSLTVGESLKIPTGKK